MKLHPYLRVRRQTGGEERTSQTLTADWETVNTMRVAGQYLTLVTVLG
jgi:hypothetical protein